MWELDHKEGWVPKNWWFWIVVLEETLESPLDSKKIKPVNTKEINLQYSLEGPMLKLKLQYHLMQRANSLEKTLMLGKIKGRKRREEQRKMGRRHHRLNRRELEQTPGDSGGQRSLEYCSPWGRKESDRNERLNNNNKNLRPCSETLQWWGKWGKWVSLLF